MKHRGRSKSVKVRLRAYFMLRCLWTAATLGGVFVGARCFADVTQRTRSNPLIAPGPDTAAMIEILQEIIRREIEAEKPVENLLLKGRYYDISKAWTEGMGELIAEDMPRGGCKEFLVVHRNGRRRAEVQSEPKGAVAYRLFDGNSLYGLNPGDLNILPLAEFDRRWSAFTFFASCVSDVHFGKDFGPLKVALRYYIRYLQGKEDPKFLEFFKYQLKCYTDDGKIVVELAMPDNTPTGVGMRSKCWIDPRVGYHVVRSEQQAGGKDAGQYDLVSNVAEYTELASGVFVLSKGTSFVRNLGKIAKKSKSAGFRRSDVEITFVDFGDFEYDEKQFLVQSLPITAGSHVLDYRSDPPLEFQFGEAPLDEQILRNAALSAPPTVGRGWQAWRIWLLVANLMVILVLAVHWLRRRSADGTFRS